MAPGSQSSRHTQPRTSVESDGGGLDQPRGSGYLSGHLITAQAGGA